MMQLSVFGTVMSPWVRLAHNPVILRALEIAAAGGHTLQVIGHPDGGRETLGELASALGINARWTLPCPCGSLGDYATTCSCSAKLVERWRRRVLVTEMTVEGVRPTEAELKSRARWPSDEGELAIARAAAVRAMVRKAFPPLNDSAGKLLADAVSRIPLGQDARDTVVRVAETISLLSGAEVLSASHVAEAVQYRMLEFSGMKR